MATSPFRQPEATVPKDGGDQQHSATANGARPKTSTTPPSGLPPPMEPNPNAPQCWTQSIIPMNQSGHTLERWRDHLAGSQSSVPCTGIAHWDCGETYMQELAKRQPASFDYPQPKLRSQAGRTPHPGWVLCATKTSCHLGISRACSMPMRQGNKGLWL